MPFSLVRIIDNLVTLCNRHPASIPALISELEWKLEQDNYLVTAIRDKLWQHNLEKQTYADTFRHLKALIKEGAETHNKLLEYRYSVKKTLTNQGIEDQKKILTIQNGAPIILKLKKVEQLAQQTRGPSQHLEITAGTGTGTVTVTGIVTGAGAGAGTGSNIVTIDGNQQVFILYINLNIKITDVFQFHIYFSTFLQFN